MNEATRSLGKAVCAALNSDDWCTAPGGGYYVKGHGYVSTAKARRLTGIAATPRVKKTIARTGPAGEWNAFVAIVLSGGKVQS